MRDYQLALQLGSVGEGIVRRFFESQGCTVEMSEDQYDQDKDMIVDGKLVEVKTLLPVYKYNSFCLPIGQSRKCESVDRLIFLEVPDSPQDEVAILESLRDEDTGRRYDFREVFKGEWCQFYRLTFLKEIGRIQDRNASESMYNLSPSSYKGFKDVYSRP